MMDDVVRRFIQDSIDVIEKENWFLMFMGWYKNPQKSFPDTQQFAELMTILQEIDKDIYVNSEKYRKSIIITVTKENIDDVLNYKDLWGLDNKIAMHELLVKLDSCLGLNLDDIIDCIHSAAMDKGLKYNSGSKEFTWE